MLELRPNCEYCDKDLPPDSTEACICTYECTFCSSCVENILNNVCPNCGGGFAKRPIRPKKQHRDGVSMENFPALTCRIHTQYDLHQIRQFVAKVEQIPPECR